MFKKYGPHTKEIKSTLAKLSDPGNKDVVAAIKQSIDQNSFVGPWKNAYRFYTGIEERSETESIKRNINSALEEVCGSSIVLRIAMEMVTFRELLAEPLTQEHYDTLTFYLRQFLEVVDKTVPGSSEREIACNLVYEGAGATESIEAARLALLV